MGRLNTQNNSKEKQKINDALIQLSSSQPISGLLNNLKKGKATLLWQLCDCFRKSDLNNFSEGEYEIIKKCIITILTLFKGLSPNDQQQIDSIIKDPTHIDDEKKGILHRIINQVGNIAFYNQATPVRVLLWLFEAEKNNVNSSTTKEVRQLLRNNSLNEDNLLLELQIIFSKVDYPIDFIDENQHLKKCFDSMVKYISIKRALKLENENYNPRLIIDPKQGYSSVVLPNTRPKQSGKVEDRVIAIPTVAMGAKPEVIELSFQKIIAAMADEVKHTQTAAKQKKETQHLYSQGSTFNGAFIVRDENNNISVCLANLGDSCAFHIAKNEGDTWQVQQLTTLHRPLEAGERERINATKKNQDNSHLPLQDFASFFNRYLKVSRSFGDTGYEETGLSYHPDTQLLEYNTQNIVHPGYLLLVTDGVHNVLSLQQMNQLTAQCDDNLLGTLPCQLLNAIKINSSLQRDDAGIVLVDLSIAQGFFAVCDGHGGQYVASRVVEQLPVNLFFQLSIKGQNIEAITADAKAIVVDMPDLVPHFRVANPDNLGRNEYEIALDRFLQYKNKWCMQWENVQNSDLNPQEITVAKSTLCSILQSEVTNLANSVAHFSKTEITEIKKLSNGQDKIPLVTQINQDYQAFSAHTVSEITHELTNEKISKELDELYDTARLACIVCDSKKDETSKKSEIITYHNKYFKIREQEYIKNKRGQEYSPIAQNETKNHKRKLKWSIFGGACLAVGIVIAGLINPFALVVVGAICIGIEAASCHMLYNKKPKLTTKDMLQDTSSLINGLPTVPSIGEH